MGKGGHLHNVAVYYGPVNKLAMSQPMLYYYPKPEDMEQECEAGNHEGEEFRDEVNSNNEGHRIAMVSVYYDDFIYGIQAFYESNEGVIPGEVHLGTNAHDEDHKFKVKTLMLECDEHITELSGRSGAWMDRLTLKTNKGNEIDVGGDGGGDFNMEIPEGMRVVSFFGGTGEYLNYIGAVVGPIPRCWKTSEFDDE